MKAQLQRIKKSKKGKGDKNKEFTYLAGNFAIKSTPELCMMTKSVYSEELLVRKTLLE